MSGAIATVALGVFAGDADHNVVEVGANNRGPRIREYLASVGLGEGYAWCAAGVFYCWDYASEVTGEPNPLEAVPLRGLVESYFETFRNYVVSPESAPVGSLVLMKFGSNDRAYDHLGLLRKRIAPGSLAGADTVEGNTGPGIGTDPVEREREGDGVYLRTRGLEEGLKPLLFIDPTDPGD